MTLWPPTFDLDVGAGAGDVVLSLRGARVLGGVAHRQRGHVQPADGTVGADEGGRHRPAVHAPRRHDAVVAEHATHELQRVAHLVVDGVTVDADAQLVCGTKNEPVKAGWGDSIIYW